MMTNDEFGENWLERVLAIEPETMNLDVAGARLNLIAWGDSNKPALLFIHGGAAHSGWWRFIAPYLLPDYYCVAVDLGGHGHSSHRAIYPQGIWAKEVAELVHHREVFSSAPVVIGHSMGGLTAIRVASENSLPGLVVIDAAVRRSPPSTGRRAGRNILGREHLYPDRQEALRRFRLIPPQPVLNPRLVAYIAENSIRQVAGGWTWLYDPRAFRDLKRVSLYDRLPLVKTSTALIRGAMSTVLDSETARDMCRAVKGDTVSIVIPDAHHHVMLDQPHALVSALREILTRWESAAE